MLFEFDLFLKLINYSFFNCGLHLKIGARVSSVPLGDMFGQKRIEAVRVAATSIGSWLPVFFDCLLDYKVMKWSREVKLLLTNFPMWWFVGWNLFEKIFKLFWNFWPFLTQKRKKLEFLEPRTLKISLFMALLLVSFLPKNVNVPICLVLTLCHSWKIL